LPAARAALIIKVMAGFCMGIRGALAVEKSDSAIGGGARSLPLRA
jgi:hypothetical protein